MKTIEVWAKGQSIVPCKGRTCGARILWAKVVKSGRMMCFDTPLTVLETRHDSGDPIHIVNLEANHWASCPDAKTFKRKA